MAADIKGLGDQIAELTLKEAKELSDYLKDEYNIEPAAGGAVMVAGPAAEGGEGGGDDGGGKSEYDVVLTGFGDKKLDVVKVVRTVTGASLMDAKKLVDGAPSTLKEAVPTEEAEKMKADIEAAGGAVELK